MTSIYNRTSMAQILLEPWKFVPDMDSSNLIAPGQEVNGDNLEIFFRPSLQLWYVYDNVQLR